MGLLLQCPLTVSAQSEDTPFYDMVERVTRFGERIPQEKVFVHMDNTSYMQGDTIWFKAYLRRTDTDKPSHVSHTLYVELRDPDGYLKERKQIWMANGEGDGFFALADSSFCFGGYYELRAYTRWQLNWGAMEHPHTPIAEKWFFNKAAARDYFRDYDKLYSRVFPIYSEYEEMDGEVYPVMWSRPMRRLFKHKPAQTKPTLSLFPEGGNLVAGVENRIAFEAATEDGRYLDGWIYANGDSAHTTNRGRGTFLLTPQKGQKTEVTFLSKEGEKAVATLEKPDENGVTVHLSQQADGWHALIRLAGNIPADSLAITIMHEGRVEDFHTMASLSEQDGARQWPLHKAKKSGIYQMTVFDTQGRVLADRLFFMTNPQDLRPTLTLSDPKKSYLPHEPISLHLQGKAGGGNVSLAVRSNKSATYLLDNGNILTEMLLASEIRGFVPQPGWYFERDDEEHRQALDLLMMTQGWRRFPWQDMALRGRFELVHPAERTPILTGAAHTYRAVLKFDPTLVTGMYVSERLLGTDSLEALSLLNERFGFDDAGGRRYQYGKDLKKNERADSIGATRELRRRLMEDGEKLRHEVKVHADFFHSHSTAEPQEEVANTPNGSIMAQASSDARNRKSVWGETVTRNGTFRMELPVIDESCFLTLAASDTTKWSKAEKTGKKKHQWYWHDETSYPEFYVRLSFPYPHFVKPYSYYQTTPAQAAPTAAQSYGTLTADSMPGTRMKEVNVTGKQRNKLQSITATAPVVRLDAMQAYNMVVDAGLLNGWMSSSEQFGMALARYLVSDMGQNRQYDVNIFYDDDLGNPNGEFSIMGRNPDAVIKKAGLLSMLDSVYIYTDYAPRKEGDRSYQASNQPEVGICVTLRAISRPVSVDRYMELPGFARTAEFYSPDYSKRQPSKEESDYRRTLYWNPYVMLDNNGEATVTLYNNSLNGGIIVSAQGQSPDGTLLWNKE